MAGSGRLGAALCGSVLIVIVPYAPHVVAGPPAAAREASAITLADIEQAWHQRGRQFESGRIKLSVTRFLAKGAISARSADSPFPMEQRKLVPPNDVTHEFTRALTFQGNKLRYSDGEPVWDVGSSDFFNLQLVSACDGGVASMLYRNPSSGPFRHYGTTQRGDQMIAPMRAVRPLLDHFCPEVHAIAWLSRYRLTKEREPVADAMCLVLALPDRRGIRDTVWLDPDCGFVVRRWLRKQEAIIRSKCDVSYVDRGEHGFLPSGWVRLEYGLGGALQESVKTEIEYLELNVPIDESEFRIEFPEGTLVEEIGGPDRATPGARYLVLADNQQRPVTRSELMRRGVSPEMLAATKPGEAGLPTRRVGLFIASIAAFCLLATCAVIAVWKWRGMAQGAKQ